MEPSRAKVNSQPPGTIAPQVHRINCFPATVMAQALFPAPEPPNARIPRSLARPTYRQVSCAHETIGRVRQGT
jgi:hypothetical protein